MKAIWILMNNKLPSQRGGSDSLIRNPFWKFVVPTVSYFAWLPECLARAFCAESLTTSPTRLYADPVQCLADLEGYEGPRGEKFGVPAALCGLTPLGDTRNSQELSVFCQMPKERLRVACGLVQEQEAVPATLPACRAYVRMTSCMPRHCRMFSNHWWSSQTGTSLPLLLDSPLH